MARVQQKRGALAAQYALDAEQHVVGGGEAQQKRVAAARAALAAALGSSSEAKSVEKKHEAQCSEGSVTQLETKPEPMAALCIQITEAVAKAAEAQVAKALSSLLSQVAADYDLDFEELKTKYLGDKAPKARKAPVKAKVTKVEVESDEDGPPQCIALTKKGDRCKCKPRNGETTCGRHKDYDPEAKVEVKEKKPRGRPRKAKKEDTSDSEEEVKPKRKPKAKKAKEPEHKHELEEEGSDCEACEQQGGPFQLRSGKTYHAPDEDEIRRRLAALDDSETEEGEVQEEGEVPGEEGE
jgi:hypothetical protein